MTVNPRIAWPRRSLLLVLLAAAALALYGHYLQFPWLHWLGKPLATGVIIAWAASLDGERTYKRWILIGLVASWFGDVALMLPGDRFVAGLTCFLLAHLCYLRAFTLRRSGTWPLWPYAVYAALAAAMLTLLWPRLAVELRVPVLAYTGVLALMAAQALASWRQHRDPDRAAAAAGAAVFVLSDGLIALDRFVQPFSAALAAILISYWMAQVLIAGSIQRR